MPTKPPLTLADVLTDETVMAGTDAPARRAILKFALTPWETALRRQVYAEALDWAKALLRGHGDCCIDEREQAIRADERAKVQRELADENAGLVDGHEPNCPAIQAWDIPGACRCLKGDDR